MKLIPKIYLAFGSLLLTFTFVTLTYVEQSENVESDVKQAVRTAEVMRMAESMEKSVVDSQNSIRGFQVSDNEDFLVTYYAGRQNVEMLRDNLFEIIENTEQEIRLTEIDSIYNYWVNSFAEPALTLQRAALESPDHIPAYEEFKKTNIKPGAGKKLIEDVREHFDTFREEEQILRNESSESLQRSIEFTNTLAITLTILCAIIGAIIVYFLAKAISTRLKEIANLANKVATGQFDVQIEDYKDDEISQVSQSLNLMTKRLENSFTSLQKTNRELDQFAYVVSHDLKAPLRAINSLAEWIEEDLPEVEPDIKRNLHLMRGRVQRMENLINGILSYSRIGRKEITPTTFSSATLVDEIIDSISPDQNIAIKIHNGLPEITTERLLLQQVLANLISNAIKYNNKTQPSITIGCKPVKGGYDFWVEDNGPGIPEEYQEKVFGIFQTMEARDVRESTGIGLAIVKKILEEKGGNIRIESEIDKFTRFVFFWPAPSILSQSDKALKYSSKTA
jgi:signal transduction histidine kinase